MNGINMVNQEKKENLKLIDKKYKLVPPDGGWGYLIAISAIITFSTTTAFAGTFGMLYHEFINEVSMSSASVTLLMGVFCMSMALAGFFTSALLRIMSLRWLAFATSVAFACGTLGTVIMTTAIMFFITAGILQGIGLGIMFNLTFTIINDYFIEKRVLIMSFVQTATGVITMVTPILVKWSLEEFGSRGTLLLIGGLSLHNFVAVLLMQPVQWHMKKVEVLETTEIKYLLKENKDVKQVDTPIIKLSDLEGNPTKEALGKALDFPEKDEKKSVVRKILESLVDTSIIKTYLFSCSSLGPAMCATADGIFIIMIPQYLYSMGWSQENVAMALTLYGFGDLAMRIIFVMVSNWMFRLSVQKIYIAGVALSVMSRLGMLWSTSVIARMVYFTLTGMAHSSIAVLIPLVVSEAVAPEKFTSAIGICLLLSGTLSIALGPAIGAIRDITNSYSVAFYTVTSLYALIVILWPIELIIKSNKRRRKIVKMNSKSSQLNKESK